MYEIESENFNGIFNKNKELFIFSNYSAESKYYNDSNALVVGKKKDAMGYVAIKNSLD